MRPRNGIARRDPRNKVLSGRSLRTAARQARTDGFTPPVSSGKLWSNEGGMKLRVAIVMAGWLAGSAADLEAGEASLIKIDGAIGPATASYIERAIDLAASRKDICLIVQLDTPGGLIESTEQ